MRSPQTFWIVRHGPSAGNVARDAAEAAGQASIDIATSACAKRSSASWTG